jgi:glycosyltransferase involved in cell wall biosynthesis
VSPSPDKGLGIAARVAHELSRRLPEVPVLLVEGRGNVQWIARLGLDFRGATNLYMMDATADPRAFWAVTRAVLVPSLTEAGGRVAQEALLNGVPALASRREGLVETVGEGGFLFDLDARHRPGALHLATAD